MHQLKNHIEKLEAFVMTAHLGSIHKASKALRIAQPSLSQTIQKLEFILDQKLFTRSHLGMALTEPGKILLNFSERLLSEVNGVEERIKQPREKMAGSFSVGTFEALAIHFWPEFIKKCSLKFPKTSFSLASHGATELYQKLLMRRFHFIVCAGEFNHSELLKARLYVDHYEFYCQSKYHASLNNKRDLNDVPIYFVSGATDDQGLTLREFLALHQVKSKHLFELETFESAKSLVEKNFGIAILPQIVLEKDDSKIKGMSIKGVPREFGQHQINLYYHLSDAEDVRLKEMILFLKEFIHKR